MIPVDMIPVDMIPADMIPADMIPADIRVFLGKGGRGSLIFFNV